MTDHRAIISRMAGRTAKAARTALVLTACCLAMSASASRALTEWHTYVQPDGTVLTLTLWGNSHFYCYKDMAGHAYSRDSLGVFHLLRPEQLRQEPPTLARGAQEDMPYPHPDWYPDRIYRQLVVLVSFSDCDFTADDPQATYQAMFNQQGYNQREGPGCVADYFRDQSGGLFNLQFDVYGPIKVSAKVQSSINTSSINDGEYVFHEATEGLTELFPDIDYSLYDWDGDGKVEQVVYVYAGYSGNQAGLTGYIWPVTSTFDTITTPDGHTISTYSASGELWKNGTSCGIGTICHEFSHCLGLPDIYPTSPSAKAASVVDEWDLMDGGHFTNRGWCPPNYSPLEKMLMGWLTPKELTRDTVVTGLKPLAEGGEAYLVRNTENEYYLIENRRQSGWDYGLPGQGLVISHVRYSRSKWTGNSVNNRDDSPGYSLVTADNLDYTDWYNLLVKRQVKSQYRDASHRLNSMILSTAPYPWQTDSTVTVNRQLSATSVPAAVMDGSVTGISCHADGTLSFVFRTSPDGIPEGDVNGDGVTDAADIAETVRIIQAPSEGTASAAADVNGDGEVTIADIIILVSGL